uniref:Protein RIC1 homolog n=2 Tax=Parascaris univalens TaxID=6257 RepID=A0A915BH36_PARUN
MFLPDRYESSIRLPGCSSDDDVNSKRIYCVVGNRDRTLYAAVASSIIYICLANPQLVLCMYRRSKADVKEKGEYRLLYWRHDSSAICTTTSKNCLLIYRVEVSSDKQCYNLVEPRDEHLRRTSQELFIKEKRPTTSISLSVVARLDSTAACVVPMREELFVCLRDGWMHRILWDGTVEEEFSFHLSEVPFAVDQLQSKPEHIRDRSVHVVDIVYTPLIGGFCFVLSNGKAALLTSPSPRFPPKQLLAVWALQLNDAVCSAANHKFRLIIFGCQNGEIAAYHLDDSNGALTCAYRIGLRIKDGPELLNRVGGVCHVDCFAQGWAFAAVWTALPPSEGSPSAAPTAPVLAIFSPFGAQMWCSLECCTDREIEGTNAYRWVDWGPEGFSLWLAANNGLSILSLSRAISVCNPNMENFENIVLLSSNRVYLSPAKEKERWASAPHNVWNIFSVPNDYISLNWPLRMAAVDRENARWIAAAGTRGFVHCNTATGKWRLFGNESQERDMLVTGGLAIWRGFVVVACYDIDRDREELRFYPLDRQLDNQYCSRHDTDSRVLMLSRRGDNLITFDLDARIFIYGLEVKERSRGAHDHVLVERCAEIRVSDLVPHPACVASIQMTSLNHDSAAAKFCDSVDTVLINVSGRLIMLSPVRREATGTESDDDDDHFQLNQPMLIASYVEHVWHDVIERAMSTAHNKPHLTQALWINCGAKGMKVWMPLFLGDGRRSSIGGTVDSNRSFINKRIMLPFDLDICPLVICSRDCLALGVESSPTFPGGASSSTSTALGTHRSSNPLYNLHRNSEVFLHHLLRQLLKRNLGVYALEIAATCTHLPYFGHVLELLLHSVLEEEATSSEPIPDPLLPRVVAFMQEFPDFLQTVAHCARKTELALWHALFAVTSHPRELFEMCIRDGQLETAASFLIVLQNMESSIASREHAAVLLEEALMKRRWLIARDIVRFLRAIDPADIDSPPRTPPCQKPHQNVVSAVSRRSTLVSPKDTEETDSFVFGSYTPGIIARPRQSHSESTGGCGPVARKDSNAAPAKKASKTQSVDSPPSPNTLVASMHTHLDDILNRHATHLLEDYSIRDLGAFAAHLEFNVVAWLSEVRNSLARVNDFGLALMRLHAQFKWPYPLVSQTVVDQLAKRIEGMRSSQSCASLASMQSASTTGSRLSSPQTEKRSSVCTYGPVEFNEGAVVTDPLQKGRNSSSVSADETLEIPLTGRCAFDDAECAQPASPGSHSYDTISNSGSDWEGLERICGEAAARGTQESELELKFMLDLMYEAGCVDWTFLLCLLRRDFSFLTKHVTAEFLRRCGESNVDRLKNGAEQLTQWADSSCFGYRTLIFAFERHLHLLSETMTSEKSSIGGLSKRKVVAVNVKTSDSEVHGRPNGVVGALLPKVLSVDGENANRNDGIVMSNGDVLGGRPNSDGTANSRGEGMAEAMTTHIRLQTPAESKLVTRAFTPPKENGNASDQGHFGGNIRPDMEVVSHINVDQREQCVVM